MKLVLPVTTPKITSRFYCSIVLCSIVQKHANTPIVVTSKTFAISCFAHQPPDQAAEKFIPVDFAHVGEIGNKNQLILAA